MRYIILVAAALCLSAWGEAGADRTVHEKGRKFSAADITVARGEQVVFLNDDTVPHNIMSLSVENGFDLGSQIPGTTTPVSFSIAGTVVIICAIHPRMQMAVKVTE